MKIVRFIVGKILLFFNWLTFPKQGERSPSDQAAVDEALKSISLYEFESCPFCVKVRRHMQRLNLKIERRDALKHNHFRKELIDKGGKDMVPCLKFENADGSVKWMYESSEIISYLDREFALKN